MTNLIIYIQMKPNEQKIRLQGIARAFLLASPLKFQNFKLIFHFFEVLLNFEVYAIFLLTKSAIGFIISIN